jgi:hypothetical protein
MHAGMSVPVHAVACARMLTTFLSCFRKDCEVLAEKLDSAGITAAYYHADMEPGTRAASHSAWSSGNIKVWRVCWHYCDINICQALVDLYCSSQCTMVTFGSAVGWRVGGAQYAQRHVAATDMQQGLRVSRDVSMPAGRTGLPTSTMLILPAVLGEVA